MCASWTKQPRATAVTRTTACIAPSPKWAELIVAHGPSAPVLRSDGEVAGLLEAARCVPATEEAFVSEVLPGLLRERDCPVPLCVAFLEAVERISRGESVWKRKQDRSCRAILEVLEWVALVECADGVRRPIAQTMDPHDPALEKIYGVVPLGTAAVVAGVLMCTCVRVGPCRDELGREVPGLGLP